MSSQSRSSSSEVQDFALFSFSHPFLQGHVRFRALDAAGWSFFASALAARLSLMLGPFLRRTGSRFSFAGNRSPFSGYGLAGTICLTTALSCVPTGRRFLEVEGPRERHRY